MKPSAAYRVLTEARAAGVSIWAAGGVICYRGDRATVESLLPQLKEHKPALLVLLAAGA